MAFRSGSRTTVALVSPEKTFSRPASKGSNWCGHFLPQLLRPCNLE